jgi:hypothetical protein
MGAFRWFRMPDDKFRIENAILIPHADCCGIAVSHYEPNGDHSIICNECAEELDSLIGTSVKTTPRKGFPPAPKRLELVKRP